MEIKKNADHLTNECHLHSYVAKHVLSNWVTLRHWILDRTTSLVFRLKLQQQHQRYNETILILI